MNVLEEVMTIQEAAEKWGVDDSTLRHAIKNNRFKCDEIKKSCKTWIVTKAAMIRLYGEIPTNLTVYTAGYEGKTIDKFVDILKQNNIDILIDVREVPISRKKGFSKSALENALIENDIKYAHFKELGSPKEVRERLHNNHDYEMFFDEYRRYLNNQTETLDIINTSIAENKDRHFCLMCFEKNPSECHRSIVAEKIYLSLDKKVDIINL